MKEIKAVCFGEVLWDVFPDKARIGGAPLNVVSRLSSFGLKTVMISKVGQDEKGDEIINYLKENGVGTDLISRDKNVSTGVVNVNLSGEGSASYQIAHPAAWDKIEFSHELLKTVENATVFVFGSLVCRDEISRTTLFQLLPKAPFKVLDFNLRAPYYTEELLKDLIQQADLIKFNDDELFEVAALMGSPYNSMEQNIGYLYDKTKAQSICVTKGRHGAVLLHEDRWYYNSGYKIKVRDTVGAGDSFLATLVFHLLTGSDIQKSLDYACAIGALVASEEGANPVLEWDFVEEFMSPKKGIK